MNRSIGLFELFLIAGGLFLILSGVIKWLKPDTARHSSLAQSMIYYALFTKQPKPEGPIELTEKQIRTWALTSIGIGIAAIVIAAVGILAM